MDPCKIRLEVEKRMQSGPLMVTMAKLPQTSRAKRTVESAIEEARNLEHNYIGTEHILLGLLSNLESLAGLVLAELGVKIEEVRESIRTANPPPAPSEQPD